MDFDRRRMDERGYGDYIPLTFSPIVFKNLWLAYIAQPKNSGKIHNSVRARWEAGDLEIVLAMNQFAQFALESRSCIEADDRPGFARLMDSNFDLRRSIYGDEIVGVSGGLQMVEIGRKHGKTRERGIDTNI